MVVGGSFVERTELQEFQGDLKDQNNGKEISDLAARIRTKGFKFPIMLWHDHDYLILDWHQRLKSLNDLALLDFYLADDLIPVVYIKADTIELALETVLEANSAYSVITESGLEAFKALGDAPLDLDYIRGLNIQAIDTSSLSEIETEKEEHNSLSDMFIVPPFSVLDTKQGYWQDRKRAWQALIQDKGESREDTLGIGNLTKDKKYGKKGFATVSILDATLAEIMNRWFCLPGGKTFDCFAGDSVFGFVSSYLKHTFTGIELRKEQADINQARVDKEKLSAKYICDDGQNVCSHIKAESQDMFFSCPPYFDLEKYSDDVKDASNQNYQGFLKILNTALSESMKCLKKDRFAVIVMSNVRDKKTGAYYDICGEITRTMEKAGLVFYNDIVLLNAIGTVAIRAGRQFNIGRKVGRMHQQVLVYYKGDPKTIKGNFENLDFSEIDMEGFNNNED